MGPPGGQGLFVVNYDALRALDATVWPAGYQAVVGGYEAVNDGGWGLFVYVPSSTDADNDGTILEPTNGIGRWFRVYTGAVNVQWFGATGDGATDDSAQIQAAIDYIESLTQGGAIFFPSATYLIETALAISGLVPIQLFGEGEGSSIITVSGAINGLEMGSGSADRTIDLRISNLSINGQGALIGIVVNRLHQILLDRCFIADFTVAGVDMNMAYNNELRDLFISDCARGIIVDENNEYTLITRCKIYNSTNVGIHFRNGSCSGSKIMFCDIENNDVGIQIDAGTEENAESIGIIGCYFKDQADANCKFGTDGSAFFIDSLLFQNNEVKAGTAGPATNVVEFDLCRKPVLMSNTFHDADVVTTANVEHLVDLGNTYDGSAIPTAFQFGNPNGNLGGTLPTADPAVTDEWWNNSGVMNISP